jgi:dihydroorotate dehydrogenase electron transfer subunit
MEETIKMQDAEVAWQESRGNSFLLVLLLHKEMSAEPGQYIFVRCGNLTLRRAFSIADLSGDRLTIIFKKRGVGTEFLSRLKVRDTINLVGPLGRGFSLKKEKSLLIGAGAGIAPVFFAKKFFKKQKIESLLIGGFNTKNEIFDELELDKCMTMDGSCGVKGDILSCLPKILEEYRPKAVYACGPTVVLRAVADLGLKYEIKTELAMEKEMACGIGVCRGCVIKIRKNGEIMNATVCKDGPVFGGEEIVW